MAWKVWGNYYLTGELSNQTNFQPVTFNDNYIIRACRTWVIFYNDPVLTSLNMKIYSDHNNAPRKLLATSTNSQLKSDMITLTNGIKEIWFEFDYFPVQANEVYHFVLNGVGYTGTSSSHLAWMKGYPDPIVGTGSPIQYTQAGTAPYQIYFIGSEL